MIHLTKLDIANDMVNGGDPGLGRRRRIIDFFKAGENAAVVLALNKGVQCFPIGGDTCSHETAAAIFEFLWFLRPFRSSAQSFIISGPSIAHPQSDIPNAIAVPRYVARYFRSSIGSKRGG